jgi:N-methylhydantoinase A/oxoprolinase/acetone carboxylase beta subunit
MPRRDVRLGIELGTSDADAVAIDARDRLIVKAKVPVIGDLRADMAGAVEAVLRGTGVDAGRVHHVMFATREARTALRDRTDLRRVAAVRIGNPVTQAIPPLSMWPEDLRRTVSAGEAIVAGGAEYDGRAAAPLDRDALERFLASLRGTVDRVAVTSVFSPVAPEQELDAAELARQALGPAAHVSLSHEIGGIGLLERENATVLNAALGGVPERLAAALRRVLDAAGIDAELFLAQNDGTLMAVEHALSYPVLMIRSGPASSMRGAAHLSGAGDAVVADVGATHAELGVLVSGFPRVSPPPTQIAGVPINFRMPDVAALPRDGLEELDPDQFADAVDRARAALGRVPLVAVGGANELVPDDLPGGGEVIRPPDREVAAAIGAAVAPVSGQVARICANRPETRRAALDEARSEATARAVQAGADRRALEIVEIEETPLTYLAEPTIRIRVTAAGPPG